MSVKTERTLICDDCGASMHIASEDTTEYARQVAHGQFGWSSMKEGHHKQLRKDRCGGCVQKLGSLRA